MAKKLTRNFRNPNYVQDSNIDIERNEFIPLWTFDGSIINLNNNVKIKKENLEGINDLSDIVYSNSQTWWDQVSSKKNGYVPAFGNTINRLLSVDGDGQVNWTNPTYSTHTHSMSVQQKTPNVIKNNDAGLPNDQKKFQYILYPRANTTNDYILNLDRFLCEVSISLNIHNNSTPLLVS